MLSVHYRLLTMTHQSKTENLDWYIMLYLEYCKNGKWPIPWFAHPYHLEGLYRFTDPIRYVSLILLIDIRFVFGMYHNIFCLKPSEISDVERRFPCVNFMI